ARRLAVTDGSLAAAEALRLGLVHHVSESAGLEGQLAQVLADIGRRAPEAVATTKRLVLAASGAPHGAALGAPPDAAADDFARGARGPEGVEGLLAFAHKRK